MSEANTTEAAAADPAPVADTPAAATPAGPEWLGGLPPELRDSPSLRRYADPAALAKSYVELEGVIGRKGVIVPGEKDGPEAHARFRAALGVPEKPDGYALAAPAGIPDGVWQPEAASAFAAVAHDAGLTPTQAQKLATWWAGAAAQAEATKGASAGETEAALRTEWGVAYDTKIEGAKRALREFGGDDLVAHLDKTGLGNDPAMVRAFARIGELVGEDRPAGMGTGRRSGVLTPADAKAERLKLMAPDSNYWNIRHPEHAALNRRVDDLLAMEEAGRNPG